MKKRVIAIALIVAMVSAFAMTSAVSAKEGIWQAGQSSIMQKREDIAPMGIEHVFVGHINTDTHQSVSHEQDSYYAHGVLNSNSNNPNGPVPPP